MDGACKGVNCDMASRLTNKGASPWRTLETLLRSGTRILKTLTVTPHFMPSVEITSKRERKYYVSVQQRHSDSLLQQLLRLYRLGTWS